MAKVFSYALSISGLLLLIGCVLMIVQGFENDMSVVIIAGIFLVTLGDYFRRMPVYFGSVLRVALSLRCLSKAYPCLCVL